MTQFIDAWRIDTGQKLEHQIPESWIRDGVNPNLTAADPGAPIPAPQTEEV